MDLDLLAIVTWLDHLEEPDEEMDGYLAQLQGWVNVQSRPFLGGLGGINPKTGKVERVPAFTKSEDAARSLKPELWVIATNERYDGVTHVTCRPRGDLDKTQVETQSKYLAIAISHACMQAQLQMKENR